MNARVIFNQGEDIPVSEMEDGELGVITSWDCYNEYNEVTNMPVGCVVLTFKENLIEIGSPMNYYRSDRSQLSDKCRVRLLKAGDSIVLE